MGQCQFHWFGWPWRENQWNAYNSMEYKRNISICTCLVGSGPLGADLGVGRWRGSGGTHNAEITFRKYGTMSFSWIWMALARKSMNCIQLKGKRLKYFNFHMFGKLWGFGGWSGVRRMKGLGGHPHCRNNILEVRPNVIFMNLDGIGTKIHEMYEIKRKPAEIHLFAHFGGSGALGNDMG